MKVNAKSDHKLLPKTIKVVAKGDAKGKKVNKAWLHDHINDPYVKQARKEGYRALAAFKLKQIG